MKLLIAENIKIAMSSISSHRVRSALTILIIAVGIMAIVGILTSIDAIKFFLTDKFAMMGANTITISNRPIDIQVGNGHSVNKHYEKITYLQAIKFKENFSNIAFTSINFTASRSATIKYLSKKTNPNITVIGSDEKYVELSGNEIKKGRNFTSDEVRRGAFLIIIGNDIARKLFKSENPIDKIIRVGSMSYRIIGVLAEKGASFGDTFDKSCIIPIINGRNYFSRKTMSFIINIKAESAVKVDFLYNEAIGTFRTIRKDNIANENSFDISKSDQLAETLYSNIKYIRLAATIIGIITLLGASIGLMNIMFVSVTERTREIGIRKAIGATNKSIRDQFIIESIILAQIGGLLGIVLGIGIGNILSFAIGAGFIIPWEWISIGLFLCFTVAIISGFLPAIKAAKLDPIESLRYE